MTMNSNDTLVILNGSRLRTRARASPRNGAEARTPNLNLNSNLTLIVSPDLTLPLNLTLTLTVTLFPKPLISRWNRSIYNLPLNLTYSSFPNPNYSVDHQVDQRSQTWSRWIQIRTVSYPSMNSSHTSNRDCIWNMWENMSNENMSNIWHSYPVFIWAVIKQS